MPVLLTAEPGSAATFWLCTYELTRKEIQP